MFLQTNTIIYKAAYKFAYICTCIFQFRYMKKIIRLSLLLLMLLPTQLKAQYEFYMKYGNEAFIAKNYEEAVKLFSQAIELRNDVAGSYVNRASAYASLGKYSEALTDLNRALELNPALPDAYYYRGLVFMDLKLNAQAIADFQKVNEMIPGFASAYYYMALVYSNQNDAQSEVNAYTKAIEADSTFIEAYYNRGLVLGRYELYDEAITDFKKCIELEPGFIMAYINKGVILSFLGKSEQALNDLNTAITIDPNSYLAYYNRAAIYNDLGLTDSAVADYRHAGNIEKKDPRIFFNCGVILLNLRKTDEALSEFSLALVSDSTFTPALINRSIIYRLNGNFSAAMADINKAINLTPKEPSPFIYRAILFHALNQNENATNDFLNVLKMWPTSSPALAGYGYMLIDEKKTTEAAAKFREALLTDSTSWNAYLGLALSLYKTDEPEAKIAYNNALKYDPKLKEGQVFIDGILKEGYFFSKNALKELKKLFVKMMAK